jgi:Lipocalin-like domain
MTINMRYHNTTKPDPIRSGRHNVIAVALFSMAVVLPWGSASGQSEMVDSPSGSANGQTQVSKDRLVGTWAYESVIVERADGTRVATFGPDPKGVITLTADGRYSMQLIRPDIPKIASKDRLNATPEENRAVVQGVVSQFGTYSVNEAEGTLTLHVETSSFPNDNGTDQERIITSISGDELHWTNPTPSTPGIAYSALRRTKAEPIVETK